MGRSDRVLLGIWYRSEVEDGLLQSMNSGI